MVRVFLSSAALLLSLNVLAANSLSDNLGTSIKHTLHSHATYNQSSFLYTGKNITRSFGYPSKEVYQG